MNITDLKQYKEKLSKLNKLEEKQRDLYLRKLSLGELQGPVTGYPTVDKPWYKYMSEENVIKDIPVKNVYQELYDNNKDYLDQTALIYFGAKISFRKFFENIDKTAKAFVVNGVKKGDFVTISSALNPETLYAFYALAKIGAVSNFMAPFFDKQGLIDRIADCDSKIAIIMDTFYDELIESINKSNIEKVVILPTLNSSPVSFLKKSKKPNTDKNETTWNKFIKEGKNISAPECVTYEKDMPVAMVYSSGTTGSSKAILLTHDCFENSIHAYPRCDVNIERADVYYQLIPPFFSTGISTSAHLPLSSGATLFMDPRFERNTFIKNNLKVNPAGTIASTSMFQGFLDDELLSKKGSLSNQKVVFQGGEKMEMEEKEAIEAVFRKYGSNAKLLNGYGQCECGAGICTQTNFTPSNTSVGIPIPGVVVGIFDDNHNEVQYNQRGELYANSPCSMKEYYKNPEATAEYFYYDENGIKWSRTGDIAVMNENGEVNILGRASDFSIINDEKIYNFDIENSIRRNDAIQNVDVFTDNNGELVAHIILNDGIDSNSCCEIIDSIQDMIYEDYNDVNYIPFKFKFRDSFPAAKNTKRDVARMKAETEGFIYSDKSKYTNCKKLEKRIG